MRFRRGDRSLEAIAYRIRVIAAANRVTQKEMADQLDLGKTTVNQWWTGAERPRIDYAWRICDRYGVDLSFIYDGLDDGLSVRLREALVTAEADAA